MGEGRKGRGRRGWEDAGGEDIYFPRSPILADRPPALLGFSCPHRIPSHATAPVHPSSRVSGAAFLEKPAHHIG